MHYSYLAYISMILSFLLAVVSSIFGWESARSKSPRSKSQSHEYSSTPDSLDCRDWLPDNDLGFPNGFSQGLSFSHRGWLFQRYSKMMRDNQPIPQARYPVISPSLLMNLRWGLRKKYLKQDHIRSRQRNYMKSWRVIYDYQMNLEKTFT